MRIKIKQIIIFWLLLIFSASAAEASWDGKWHVFWKHGAFIMTMEQHGNDVNGSYESILGTLKGHIEDNKLHAVTLNENGQNNLTLIMGQTGSSFFGNAKTGDWMTGIKVDADSEYNTLSVDDNSPMNTFYSFLKLGNKIRTGHHEALEKALELLYMDENQQKYYYGKRLALTRTFFQILDSCTVEKHLFNRNTQGNYDSVTLHQAGSTNTVEVEFIKVSDAEEWKISVPSMKIMEETLRTLMHARERHEFDPNENLKLANPRDTMRTFLEQYKRWDKNGKAYVISTMNLSAVDPAIWE